MKVTAKILDMIRQEIESINYGTVAITVNEKGNYVEIHTEQRKRVVKDPGNEGGVVRGVEKVYHEDGKRPDPIHIN